MKLDDRLAALAEAAELAGGRLGDEAVAQAAEVVERAGRRLGLGVDLTVVALAGPTGAGKSSLFNAIVGAEVARASPRRPTTSAAAAAVWGEGGEPLLDWLEVARRHRVPAGTSEGLVLLDLPDFDSIEAAHREEFERLLGLVDLVVWTVDPEKYADAALHDRYLRPLADRRATMLVALNQADRLDGRAVEACRRDLSRLLGESGLDGVAVLAVSARDGTGLDELRSAIGRRVQQRTAAVQRLAADVTTAARALAAGCGEGAAGKVRGADRDRLVAALAAAAGVPSVVRAVDRAHRRRGALATGWPPLRWVRRFRPDPLRRLRLPDRGTSDAAEATSLPAATPLQRAQVAGASRALAASAAGDLPQPWPGLLRDAALAREEHVVERLDRAVAAADLRVTRPRWWGAAGALQTLLALVALAGGLWLLALIALGYLQLDDALPMPKLAGIPLPTLLLAGGLLAGALLALLTRLVNGLGARRRARRAGRALGARVEEVAAELVVGPVDDELAARERLCRAVGRAAAA